MKERVARERERWSNAVPSRVGNQVRMAGTDDAPDLFERDCHKCQADLNWAGVRCECKSKRLYCLRCVKECNCNPHRSTVFYRHTIEELDAKCARLEELAKPSGNLASSVVVVPAPPPGFSGSGAGSCMSLHCSLVTSPGLAVK